MLRRPSHFVTASNLVSRQELDLKGKGDGEGNTTISMTTLQDEIPRNRKQKSNLKGFDKRSEPSVSESKSSKSVDLKETKKQPEDEQIKKDILDYLDNLIEKSEWLALKFFISNINKYYIHFLIMNFFSSILIVP